MGKEDLRSKLEELRKELIKTNAQISTGTTPKSPGHVKQIKKNIAKILMILNEGLKSQAKSEILSESSIRKEGKEVERKT